MMLKTFEILLDIEKELYSPSNLLFRVSRNDLESVELQFVIRQDESTFNLTGTTVQLAIKKPSGLTVYQDCEITNAIEGKASVILSTQSYIEQGVHTAEVYVKTSTQLAVTSSFYYFSRESVLTDETEESVNEWSDLQQALFAYDLKPILTTGFPTAVPEYIGQMAFDTVNNLVYIANDLTSVSWQAVEGGGGGGGASDTLLGTTAPTAIPARIGQLYINTTGKTAYIATGATAADWEQIDAAGLTSVSWNDVTGKPLTFPADVHTHTFDSITGKPLTYPPDSHTHNIAAVDGLQVALDGKADDAHSHTFDSITGKPATYPADPHSHSFDSITGKPLTYPPDAHTHTFDSITGKPLTYPPDTHTHTAANISDFATAVGANIPAEYLTTTEGDARYLQNVPAEYLTQTEGDVRYLQSIPAEYITETEGDARYSRKPSTGTVDPTGAPLYIGQVYVNTTTGEAWVATTMAGGWQTISADETGTGGTGATVEDNLTSTSATNALSANQGRILNTNKSDVGHTHTAANISDFGTAVASNIPAEYLTATEGDARYLQTVPVEYLTEAEGDVRYLQSTDITGKQDKAIATTGAPATTPAYVGQMAVDSTNGNSYIAEGTTAATDWKKLVDSTDLATKSDTGHTHTAANISDFGTAVGANIPAEYLTQTEGDTRYMAAGSAPTAHNHAIADITNLQTTLDGKADDGHTHTIANVSGLQTALDGKADEADLAGKSDVGHVHTIANVSDLQTTLDGKQPKPISVTAVPATTPTHAGQMAVDSTNKNTYIAEGTAVGDWKRLIDAADLATKSDTTHTHTEASVTFGGTNAKTYVDNADNFITGTVLGGKKIWTGTEAAYTAIGTKDANTLYFVTG